MKKQFKSMLGLLFLSIALSGVIAFVSSKAYFLAFINTTFTIGLLFVVIGGFLTLGEKGFFKIAHYPLYKVKFLFSGDKQTLDHKKQTFKEYMDKPLMKYELTRPILWSGIILTALSYLLSFSLFNSFR